MIPWQKLGEATMPGGGPMTLMQRGSEYSVMSGTITLMNSRMSNSEEQLANISAARLGSRPKARILIGGLGLGFTLRAALKCFAADSEITVAELVPEIVDWARGPLLPLHGDSLEDPRVRIHLGDVSTAIAGGRPFDAILLDVDNGPDGLFRPANDRLYNAAGLAAAKAALAPGGHLAIWSSHPDDRFTRRLRQTGMPVDQVTVRARNNGKGDRHTLWFATRSGGQT